MYVEIVQVEDLLYIKNMKVSIIEMVWIQWVNSYFYYKNVYEKSWISIKLSDVIKWKIR